MPRSDAQAAVDEIHRQVRDMAVSLSDTQAAIEKKVAKLAEKVAAAPYSDRLANALIKARVELAERRAASTQLLVLLGSVKWRVDR